MSKYESILKDAEAVRAKASAESREMTAEESNKVLELVAQAKQAQADEAKIAEANAALAAMKPARKTSPVVEVGADLVAADPKKGFKTPAQFLQAIRQQTITGRRDERLNYLATAGSDENHGLNDAYGAFLVPEVWAPVMSMSPETTSLANLVTRIPTSKPVINIPAVVDKNHSTSVCGGLTFTRKAQTSTAATSRLQFENIQLNCTTLMGTSFATGELLQDSAEAFTALLAQRFGAQYQFHRDGERINGTGVGEPLGMLKSAAVIEVAKVGSQTADTFNLTNALAMMARFYGQGGVWLMNPDLRTQIATLAATNGMSLVWQPSSAVAGPETLFGKPVIYSEHMAKLGDAGDVALVDPSAVVEAIYQPLESASSIHVRFLENEECFRFIERSDSRPTWTSVLTPKNGATRSPFITLAERA